ncbi:thiamine pyrophosphate-dependent dehydrogenase E1 component subunit alpha [Ferrovibrio sp.]|uniref:thiamine pyrophosphate-dependent dehydrogenase E1 component subunit alpha n=1 Tax=Ferrovibrio sp. TaxID=1917215 RepID=UPI003D2E8357
MNTRLELFRRMRRIRVAEETIAQRYNEQKMRCPTHLSIGQELVGALAGMVLRPDDPAVSTHRGHAHYLGKGGDLKAMIAEIYGKVTGCARGRGGSMHLIDESVGFMGTTAIVGNSVPIGVGLGLSIKLDGDDRVAAIFLGDGCTEEGAFYESANIAVTRKLPVIFICENNLYSVYSPLSVRQPSGRRIHELAASIGLHTDFADGADAGATHDMLSRLVAKVRSGAGPALAEISTYRWREHCGPNYDDDLPYRSAEEIAYWRARDSLDLLEKVMVEGGELSAAEIAEIDASLQREVQAAFDFAEASAFPAIEEAYSDEYAG